MPVKRRSAGGSRAAPESRANEPKFSHIRSRKVGFASETRASSGDVVKPAAEAAGPSCRLEGLTPGGGDLGAMPRGRHEPAGCRRRSLDSRAFQERPYRRQARDHRAAARFGMELGDHPREALPLRQDAQRDRQVRAGVLVGAVARGALPGSGPAPEHRHGGAVRRGDARMEAIDRARRRRARHAADARRPAQGREGDGRDHLARGGAARTKTDLPRHRRLDRALSSACSARCGAS